LGYGDVRRRFDYGQNSTADLNVLLGAASCELEDLTRDECKKLEVEGVQKAKANDYKGKKLTRVRIWEGSETGYDSKESL
jgi:hypothetical protein